jgi:hypothetical protein
MDEATWMACTNPTRMVDFLRCSGKVSARKLRLFACACCRRIWDRFPDPCNRSLVATVEDHPDGNYDDPELNDALIASSAREWEFGGEPAFWVAKNLGRGFYKVTAAQSAVGVAVQVAVLAGGEHERQAEMEKQAALLRDVFGNPFHPLPPINLSLLTWNGGLIRTLAQAAYDDRLLPSGELDPARLGVLADALTDAGFTDAELLEHLRGEGPHLRGCYGVDLLLSRK